MTPLLSKHPLAATRTIADVFARAVISVCQTCRVGKRRDAGTVEGENCRDSAVASCWITARPSLSLRTIARNLGMVFSTAATMCPDHVS